MHVDHFSQQFHWSGWVTMFGISRPRVRAYGQAQDQWVHEAAHAQIVLIVCITNLLLIINQC